MGTKKKGLLNASERDGVEYRKVKLWEIVCGRANNGVGVSFYMLIGFASMIATEGYGIAMALAGMLSRSAESNTLIKCAVIADFSSFSNNNS